jgi:hypothetical protein
MTPKKKRTTRTANKAAPTFKPVDKTTDAPEATQVITEGQPPEQEQAAPPPYQGETPEVSAPDNTSDSTTGNDTAQGIDEDIDYAGRVFALTESFKGIGRFAANATGVEDAALDDEDADALARAWAPLLPSMSPATQAIMITVMILMPKALLVSSEIKKRRKNANAGPERKIKEAEHEQSSQ